MQKTFKRTISILLSILMIVSLFAAVPMTVNAAPPGSGSGEIGPGGTGTVIGPVQVSAGFETQPYAIEGLVANGSEQALISAGTTADGATAYYYMTTEDITGEQANSLFNSPSKPGSFSTSIPKGTDAGTYYVWYAIDGGSNYEDLLPYMEISNTYITNKLTVTIAAPTYTVTWKNGDTVLETDTDVAEGATPTYDGETPTKDGVTFAGWTDSHGVFYAKDATLPEVTADETYTAVFELTIGSVDEWNSFAASVKGGNTYSRIIVRMTADVGPVTTMVDGTFSGTFDGDGHTLTVNISGGSTSAATFAYVKDATIQNLRLEGTVTSSGIHTAALVKSVSDTGSTCTIKNVDIYADVNCSNGYIGGFIGHAGTANTVNIENSIFAGSINKTGSTQGNFIGAFIGWSQTLTATINNCAFTGSYNNIKSFNNIGFSYNAPTKVTVSGFYSNASEVFVANVNHGTRLYVPSSSYPTTVALVKNNDGETLYSAFSDALAAWTDGSTLALLADVTCDSLITVPAADTKTLDLNGNALSLSYSSTKVEVNGTLTIQSTASGGSITPTTKSRVINVVDGGTLNIESGTINGYNADRAVIGGVGTINLNGGKIVTPASNAFSPDGVATLNLNGGEIECTSGSTSMGTASAVWAHGDSTINWNGTAITTNTGDGIRMKSAGNGTVNVTGGSFTATSSSLPEEGGYAIYCNSNMGTLNLEGNPSISGRGIYLADDKVINITNDLSNTNPISVTMQTPGVFTSGLSGNGDASNFANGNGTGYALTLNASGEAQIVSTHTITWKLDANTEIDTTEVVDGVVPTHAAPSKAADNYYTYTFAGWNDGETTYAPNELPAATADVTYTAQFTSEARTFMVFVKKPTGATINVYDVSGETTVAQLKDILASQTGVPASEQRLIFAGKTLDDAKTLAEYNIQKESTIHLNIGSYTVTWLNYDNSELGTTTVQYGDTPTYDGEVPTKAADDSKHYTFAGWNDGQTTYAPNEALPQVSGTVTYTAQFTGTDHAWDTANAVWDAEPEFYADPDNYGEDAYKANVTVTCTDCQKTKTFTASTSGRFFAIEDVSSDCEEGTGSYTKVTVYATIGGEDISHVYHVNEGPVEHEFVSHVAAKEATYEADGNIEYWQCEVCGKCFSDEDCNNEITQAQTVIPKLKKLFTGHSVTLGGDIGVNFFLNPAVLDTYTGTKTVKFTVDGKETTVDVPATKTANGYVVTCNVVAAQMAHKISAVVYVGDTALDQTDSYSVQDYADAVYAEPGKYLPADDADKAPALKALAAALLHYGGEAQTVFATSLTEHPDRADKKVGAADYSGVDAAAVTAKINGEASDLNAVATDLNAKYHTNSLIYLQNNTLRVYFTPTTYPSAMPNAGAYDGNLSNYYYYKDKANIAAAELDDQQDFTVGNVSFKYSPLNYVVNVLNSNMSPEQKNLAKSLFLYNQAANAFFDEPVIADDENIVDLATLTAAYEAQDGDVLTGELKGDYQITVAAGATVTLRDANITCLSNDSATANFAGITPLGDATILLEGTNIVKGGHKRMPGIYIPANKTLTIDGTGSLEAYSGGDFSSTSFSDSPASCGIGGKRIVSNGAAVAGGNLVINGGTITAYGGSGCAGIGSCTSNDTSNPKMFGDITINGGTVTASALDNAAGIGSGKFTSCGNITITGGTVTATGDGYAAGIGSGLRGGCGDITIAGTVTQVTATKGEDAEASIGAGEGGSCGTVTIADPSKVTQN